MNLETSIIYYIISARRKPRFLISFVRTLIELYVVHLTKPIQWECIPSYFIVLRTILPILQESV